MSRGLVLLGDKTTHGGEVISASSNYTVNGKKVSVVGDLVNCPVEGHGINPIVEGSSKRFYKGRALVIDNCKCQCGCHVISSASNNTES